MKETKSQTSKQNNAQGKLFEKMILTGCAEYRQKGIAEIEKTPEPFSVVILGVCFTCRGGSGMNYYFDCNCSLARKTHATNHNPITTKKGLNIVWVKKKIFKAQNTTDR